MEVTAGEVDSTAEAAGDSMEVAEEGFTGVEVSTPEAALGTAGDTIMGDIVAATMEGGATPEAALGTAGDTTMGDIVAATMEDGATPEAALGTAGDTTMGDIAAATMEDGATTEVAAVMAGAEDIGAEDTVMDGAGDGDLALGGRIGVGDTRMATTTARGITRPTLIIILTPTIRILTTGTTILHPQIPTHGPSPTRTDPQNPGNPRHREAQSTRTTQTATSRPLRRVGRFSPLTG
jgi:hypothetical protein